jgi:hypothetical protein
VRRLRSALNRHVKEPHRFLCFTDRTFVADEIETAYIEDMGLTRRVGCFARLRLFEPDFQRRVIWRTAKEIESEATRLVNVDLDTILTNNCDGLFPRGVSFKILQGANAANPCPFVGALFMLKPGAHPELWHDFSLAAVEHIPRHEFADDQGWMWHKLKAAPGWQAGTEGVYAFQKPGWPKGFDLPADARLVTFIGWRKPRAFKHLPWVQNHWR